ncbi:MAG: ADYC domain-containing protein [Nannocystaceae bacterium]
MRSPTLPLLLLALLLAPACALEEAEAEADDLELRTTAGSGGGSGGGPVFNTHVVEDLHFSELVPPEDASMGVALLGVELEDGRDAAVAVDDEGELVAEVGDEHLSGAALIGSTWWIGSTFWLPKTPLRILDAMKVDGVTRYAFAHPRDGEWTANCPGKELEYVRVLRGIALQEGSGDLSAAPSRLFLSCPRGAVGKAASWGYYDLAEALDDLDVFETAIRVVRADYCYDGVAHTAEGVELLVEDRWGIRGPVPGDWPLEAVWGADGLLCAGTPRHQLGAITCGAPIPACVDGVDPFKKYPGARFVSRVLFLSASDPQT